MASIRTTNNRRRIASNRAIIARRRAAYRSRLPEGLLKAIGTMPSGGTIDLRQPMRAPLRADGYKHVMPSLTDPRPGMAIIDEAGPLPTPEVFEPLARRGARERAT